MKVVKITISGLLLGLVLLSCKKAAQPITLVHKWSVLYDTTYYSGIVNTAPRFYVGQLGDYFDFRTDNNLYIKEGTLLDTVPYNIASDGTINIYYKRSLLNGDPPTTRAQITESTAVLFSFSALTPQGAYGRFVHLSR